MSLENSKKRTGWSSLVEQWEKDIQLFTFVFAHLFLSRLILLGIFSDRLNENTSLSEMIYAIIFGARYDLGSSAAWILVPFFLSLTFVWPGWINIVERIRMLVLRIFIYFGVTALCMNIVYFYQYGDQFNNLIFALIYDDTWAILVSIWKEFHPLVFLSVLGILIYFDLQLGRRWMQYDFKLFKAILHLPSSIPSRTVVYVFSFGIFVIAMRGGELSGTPLLLKHSHVTDDTILNRMIANPLTALRETVVYRWKLLTPDGFKEYWPKGDVKKALATAFPDTGKLDSDRLDDYLQREVQPVWKKPARHVFVLLLESHSGWPLHPAYQQFNLSPGIVKLGQEGQYFQQFLHSGSGTIGSLTAILTGIPSIGAPISHELESYKTYSSSIAHNFKRLGYRARFFYGGFPSWRRLDQLSLAQGFDEMYGAGDVKLAPRTNEWGVDDEYLFDFIASTLDDSEPTFNFILTTSNHAPYDLNLINTGYTAPDFPDSIKPTKALTNKALGHLWYTDKYATEFVRRMNEKLPNAVFAITGDHTQKLEINFPGDYDFERYTVPLVLWGPDVLPEHKISPLTPGSHIDIPATLYDLAAPAGFRYAAFGKSMFHKQSEDYGFGYAHIIGANFLMSAREGNVFSRAPLQSNVDKPEDPASIKRQFTAMKSVAHYRVRNGSVIENRIKNESVYMTAKIDH